jgi:bifunctional non-homologous end joining protein LigD
VLKRPAFIVPSQPVLKQRPPTGFNWIHEVKFDGWRAQLHRYDDGAAIFGKSGKGLSSRFPVVRAALGELPHCIIDAELVGCDADGVPDFRSLMAGNAHGFCAWCFDLMMIGAKDLRAKPLEERRARLQEVIARADTHLLRFSEAFDDPEKLLRAVIDLDLEGIVSKRRDQRYVSGKNTGWIKVKTAAWREANRDRSEIFEKAR